MPPRATTHQRGLGYAHQQQRGYLLRNHTDGTPCWWCGQPMYRTQKLAADHTHPRATSTRQGTPHTPADRLLHATCNIARHDGHRDHKRPALKNKSPNTKPPPPSREW